MADKKISDLPAATTPLAGTEVLPIVQGGTTDKVAVSDLTAGRAVSSLNLAVTGSTVPANGVYLPAANTLGFATNTTAVGRFGSTGIFYIGTTTTPTYGSPKLVVNGNISGGDKITVNSSTATTIATGAGLLFLVRNNTHGGTAIVAYENTQTPTIIANTGGGTTFQTTTPSGSAQIQLTNKSGNLGVAALTSSDRNNAELSVTVLQSST